MNSPIFIYVSIAVVFGLAGLLAGSVSRKPEPAPIDPKMITLKSMAIRLRYLLDEGTLSKTGNTIRFEADGSLTACDFIDAITAIAEAVE